ncbi:hypothetical protein [Streptomyces sp. NPDC051079]|uniref:hypothetical protein n=1 Tax=Streptomyces sp. NPDC051079 TaxID=3155043 RepID=UPI00344E7309
MSAREELMDKLTYDVRSDSEEWRGIVDLLDAFRDEVLTAAALVPTFFQPGFTYQRRRWQFQCLAVAPNPFNGETRAVGFLHRPGEPATATALDPDDWAHGGWLVLCPVCRRTFEDCTCTGGAR